MNKRVVAVVLAGAMAASQLAGPVEVIAAQTSGEVETTASGTPEKVLEEGMGVDTPVETAKDTSVQTQAVLKGWLKADNKVYTVDGSTGTDVATAIEITDLATVTHLLVGPSVTSIPNNLFKGKANLTEVSIIGPTNVVSPETNVALTSIGTGAFEGTSLVSVKLPSGLTDIGESAFADISTLTTVDFTVSTTVATIGANAFKGSSALTTVALPGTVTSIGASAFAQSGLTTIAIPARVTSIEANTFQGTAALKTIDLTGATALATIGANAFENSGLTTVAIPATVTSIGASAFKGSTNMGTLDLSGAAKLATIEASAFENVRALGKELDFSSTVVTTIGASAFKGTEISVAILPAALLTIGDAAFQNVSNLLTVDFSKAVAMTAIGNNAFEGTAISAASFPATLLTIGDSAFKGTLDLASADFSTSTKITSIGESAFEGSGVTGALDLSGITAVVEIKDKAFKGNGKLTSVTLPGEMVTLKAEVFAGTALKTIEINEKCTAVTASALPATLESITVAAANAALSAEDGVLYDQAKANMKLVPMAKAGELTLPATVTTVEANAAKGNTKLTAVKLVGAPELKDIEANAFEGTTALKLLDLRKATKLDNVKAAAFKGSALNLMYLGKDTKDFTTGIAADAFNSTATSKIAKFLKDDDTEVDTADLAALEVTWNKLTTPAGGSWTFYRTPVKPAVPAATVNYADMKLESLTSGTTYKITVDTTVEEHTADGNGKIALKKEWGGKTIKIASVASGNNLESDAQELEIKGIYTVTVNGTIEKTTIAGETVTFNAAVIADKTFIKWEVEGVTLPDATVTDITFEMPANDVTLTKIYKTTNTTAPTAATNYADMTLKDLSPNAAYTIEAKEVVADSNGKVAIEKEWSDKEINIVKNETETETQSPEQKLKIEKIYSITVGETEVAISVKDEAVTITAPAQEGHLFKQWTEGYSDITVSVGSETTETITFTMLDKDVTLKAEYTKIVITKPEDMVYDGEKEVSVELDVPLADFEGIMVDGKMLEKDKDYTVSEGSVITLASGKTIVKFTKTYLDSLEKGVNAFKAVLKGGKEVGFSVNVVEKPTVPDKPPVVFPDVDKNEWYADAIDHVSSKEYMTGFADGKFGPADTLGRGQFASILHRMGDSPVESYNGIFTDVPDGTFYTMPVIWAHKNKVITGYEGGKFGPSDSMTREQLVTMLYRYTQIKGGNTVARASIESFPDKSKVSGFATEAMQWAVAQNLVSGDNGQLNPQGIASRAVAATLIQRFETKQKPEVTPPAPDTTTPAPTP